MKTVFLLQHLLTMEDGEENTKIIGIYSLYNSALNAILKLEKQPGFCDNPRLIDPDIDEITDGFYIDEYPIDKDHWEEGFIICKDY